MNIQFSSVCSYCLCNRYPEFCHAKLKLYPLKQLCVFFHFSGCGNQPSVSICRWLVSFRIMPWRFTCIVACDRVSFSRLNNTPSMCIPHFVCLSVTGHLGCFDFLTVMNSAAVMCTTIFSKLFSVLVDLYPAVGLLDQMIVVF